MSNVAARRKTPIRESTPSRALRLLPHPPHLYCSVVAGGSHALAIGGPGHTKHEGGMTTIDKLCRPTGGIPYLNRGVHTARCNIPAIGRPCDTIDCLVMALVGYQEVACCCIPHLCCGIVATRHNAPAIGGPSDKDDSAAMASVSKLRYPCSCVPHLD